MGSSCTGACPRMWDEWSRFVQAWGGGIEQWWPGVDDRRGWVNEGSLGARPQYSRRGEKGRVWQQDGPDNTYNVLPPPLLILDANSKTSHNSASVGTLYQFSLHFFPKMALVNLDDIQSKRRRQAAQTAIPSPDGRRHQEAVQTGAAADYWLHPPHIPGWSQATISIDPEPAPGVDTIDRGGRAIGARDGPAGCPPRPPR